MGAVNLLAPEEYATVRDRCESLAAQLGDLEAASAQLNELRQRLEDEIDTRFRTVFQSVAINFQEFFADRSRAAARPYAASRRGRTATRLMRALRSWRRHRASGCSPW